MNKQHQQKVAVRLGLLTDQGLRGRLSLPVRVRRTLRYLEQHPDLGRYFDGRAYLDAYPDARQQYAGSPLLHYLLWGEEDGLVPALLPVGDGLFVAVKR